jgi:hypothetical protein
MMGVQLGGFGGVVLGMGAMARGGVGMMGGGFRLVFFIMLGGFAMMVRGLFVMLGGVVMMLAGGVLVRHWGISLVAPAPSWRGWEYQIPPSRSLNEAKMAVDAVNLCAMQQASFTNMSWPRG